MNRAARLLTLPNIGLFSALLLAPALTGCGGGSSSITRTAAPTATTRAAVQKAMGRQVNSLSLSGASNMGAMLVGTLSGAGASSANSSFTPNLGGFFNQLAGAANATHGGRAAHKSKHTRDVPTDFDEWLGLYTTVTETEGKTETLLFLDAAKTQPAGQVVSIFPADYSVYPQVYRYTFQFTGGAQIGSEGHYNSTIAADGTYTSEYASTSAFDGTSYSGTSSYTASGTSSYSGSYSSTKDNSSGSYQGQYNADGTGFSRSSDSTGYASEYRYAADGSFTATISGPDPGLPAQINFNAGSGNYTITYADGTSETFSWGYWASSDGGSGNSGSGGSGDSGSVTGSDGSGSNSDNVRKAK